MSQVAARSHLNIESIVLRWSVVTILIGVTICLLSPNYVRASNFSPRSSCIANLKQLDSAKEQWAIDNHKGEGAKISYADLVGETLYMKGKPTCPNAGKYVLGRIGDQPICTVEAHKLPVEHD